jgi:TonB family protein
VVRLFLLVLVCGLYLASGEVRGQSGKASEKSLSGYPAPTNPTARLLLLEQRATLNITDVDTTGLLDKHTSTSENAYVANQCFAQLELPVYRKQTETDDLRSFVARNLEWPDKSGRWNVEGKVYVQFIVNEEGKVRDARVTKGLHPLFDAEALRVVNLLSGHFESAKRNGIPISCPCTLPITFAINY